MKSKKLKKFQNYQILEEFRPDMSTLYNQFGVDMTLQAESGELDPVIGREKELNQLVWILCRKLKNNPVLIGEPGVGKTAAVEKLAQIIASGDCPQAISGKKIISIEADKLSQIVQGNQLGNLIEEVKKYNLIIFVDEIHLIKGLGDALKPALARGLLNLIGATTLNEYRESIEKDGALERRFQKIYVDEPSIEECFDILNGVKVKYESYHKVSYTEDAIRACISLSKKYITDRFLPDKAIDLLDEVGAKVRMGRTKDPKLKEIEKEILAQINTNRRLEKEQNFEEFAEGKNRLEELKKKLEELKSDEKVVEITKAMVEEIVQLKTRIPIKMAQGEKESIKDLPNKLKLSVIGQDEAVGVVARSVMRTRAGLGGKNRPQGVFLFLGPTGVGKTQLVKSLAKQLMGSEDNIIRFDMSEFASEHTASRLYGSPPGYVGYGEGGQLTEKVRRKPYSIVLLDEIEKASPKIFDAFLQVFDDGHMTDGQGRKVDFKNTIIIMTSNIGSKAIQSPEFVRKSIGFVKSSSEAAQEENKKSIIMNELKKTMRPEFLNRIDEIIVFKSLDKENLYKIVDLELKKVADKLEDKKIKLNWTVSVKDMVLQQGFDPEMGARPLRRAIQKYVEDPITDFIINDKIEDVINLDTVDVNGQLKITVNGEKANESKRYLTRLFTLLENKNIINMKYLKRFESFGAASPAPAPETVPTPAEEPRPGRPVKPVRPDTPSKPIETPSVDPGPIAETEKDVVNRLQKELGKQGQKLSDFIKKYKK